MRVAGIRWCVEESFQAGEGRVGPHQYEVRGWTPWNRFITLAMLALAFLSALAAITPPHSPDPHHHARDNGPIVLTTPEIRRLFRALLGAPAEHLAHLLRWSLWRRRRQGRARQAHYRRRLAAESNP